MSQNPRGAPPGNLNALKHGFYSPRYRIQDAGAASLEQEILLLRLMIRHTVQLARGCEDLKVATRALDSLGAAATRLANLLKAQKSLQPDRSQISDQISRAIQQANQELRSKP